MGRQGVKIYSRHLRYRNRTVTLPDGTKHVFPVGQEKGIDVRSALDVVRTAYRQECDVILIFSQDQDLSELADEVRLIAREQRRWIKIASAFPLSPTVRNRRGINKTDWIPIDRATYDQCLDRRDYRPK
ncbi:MAG: NYN domain-containing protein [Deltaproteobacteria bacterium]|nr:NYN domain-containing protein [Deltaproteobacteria bacterium]